jgi:hypothetical protein
MADVVSGGTTDAVTPLALTVVVSSGGVANPVGSVSLDRVGIDTGGNIWLMYPKTTISGTTAGGWLYAATVTAGGLPLATGGTTVSSGGSVV